MVMMVLVKGLRKRREEKHNYVPGPHSLDEAVHGGDVHLAPGEQQGLVLVVVVVLMVVLITITDVSADASAVVTRVRRSAHFAECDGVATTTHRSLPVGGPYVAPPTSNTAAAAAATNWSTGLKQGRDWDVLHYNACWQGVASRAG
jgi:hypothetical protein